jgi:hypothetical protein
MVQKSTLPSPHSGAGSAPPTLSRAPAKGDTLAAPGTVMTSASHSASSGAGETTQPAGAVAGLAHGTVSSSGHGASSGGGSSGK